MARIRPILDPEPALICPGNSWREPEVGPAVVPTTSRTAFFDGVVSTASHFTDTAVAPDRRGMRHLPMVIPAHDAREVVARATAGIPVDRYPCPRPVVWALSGAGSGSGVSAVARIGADRRRAA